MVKHNLDEVTKALVATNQNIKEIFASINDSIENGYVKNSSAAEISDVADALKSLKVAFQEINETRKQFKDLRKAYKRATKL